jgi:hypothetical protein
LLEGDCSLGHQVRLVAHQQLVHVLARIAADKTIEDEEKSYDGKLLKWKIK